MSKLNLLGSGLMAALPLLACAKRSPETHNDANTKLLRESTAVQAVLDDHEWERPKGQMLNTRINLNPEESIVKKDGTEVCRMNFKRTWGEAMNLEGRIDKNLSDGTITRCSIYLDVQDLDGYQVTWKMDGDFGHEASWNDFSVNREAVNGDEYRKFSEIFHCHGTPESSYECGYNYRLKGTWVEVDDQPIRKNSFLDAAEKICKKTVEAAGLDSCK